MVNRQRGEIAATLDGRSWTLCLTLGALAELEAALDAPDLMALARRFEAFEAAGPHEWMPNNRLFGLKRLPVRGQPAHAPDTTAPDTTAPDTTEPDTEVPA